MPVTDQISDMLTRVRNANLAHHDHVLIPASKLKLEVSKILKAQGYIQKYDLVDDKRQGQIRIHLRYVNREPVISGLRRISRPGVRIYVDAEHLPRGQGGRGVAILSTSQGVLTDREAHRRHIGGEDLKHDR